jgi:uncharacterized SAM-binding protein YcdF (DUF218 family)
VTSEAGRILITADLARRFPKARVIYSGAEAATGARWLENIGVPKSRIELEMRSYNTAENARYSFEMARPHKDQIWLLVTSAYHMPRAVGSFRAVGFTVEPYPVHGALTRSQSGMSALWRDQIVHEWLGLIFYRLTGRTKELFPGPKRGLNDAAKAVARESGV